MGLLTNDIFVCLDCEATGLNIEHDRIIEVAVVKFTFEEILDSFETLVNPGLNIPQESQLIHNISNEMVYDKPTIKEVLPKLLTFIDKFVIIGHGIYFDIDIITREAQRLNIDCTLKSNKCIDTLRLARLYGECPVNSLENLREHFNIPQEVAHRAMNDVKVNIPVFKRLSSPFSTTEQLLNRLEKPILMKIMPLGKHKGRKFSEIPTDYLQWAAGKDFDQDLLYSIRVELKKRKQSINFEQASNPFSGL
jgi:DNA polymerase III subunit epsilon